MGLYFKLSIVFFYIPIIAVCLVIKKISIIRRDTVATKKIKLVSSKRYFRYLKLVLNLKVIFCIIIFSVVSNSIVIFQNQKYESLYHKGQSISEEAIVVSNRKEKEYYYLYKIKLICNNKDISYKNIHLYLKINKKSTEKLEYGDKIKFSGEFIEPTAKRNYGGFDYKEYLKTLKIYGSVEAEKIELIEENKANLIFSFANKISLKIKQEIDLLIEKEEASIVKGILLGDNSEIEEEIQENFRTSNISHVLAISGMHVSYIVLGMNGLLKSKIGKRKIRFIIIIFLIFYMFITGFSPSVVRASIMCMLVMGAEILYRKNDIWTSIAISLFLILIYNPFLIKNIGLQFSYVGTIGIIVLHKNIFEFLKSRKIKNRKWRYRSNQKIILLVTKIKELLAVNISAQLAIFPIMIYHFNMFGVYFLITNLLVSAIIGPIIILGGLLIGIGFVFNPIAKILSLILEFLVKVLIIISSLSRLPFSKIYLPTPKIWIILLYYILIIIFNSIYSLYYSRKINNTQRRVRNLIALLKYKILLNKERYLKRIFIMIMLFLTVNLIPKNLEINFVDVGQGDCTFVITPGNKTILIDGGGSNSKQFDVGKNILLPYILDKGYTKIDYIFISHFDQDHVGGILTILQELKVGKVIVAKQKENSENYKKFLELLQKKKIVVKQVKSGDIINIERSISIKILFPTDTLILDNPLNNNSIVCKLVYNNFSVLFTGDIEAIAEKNILKLYNKEILNSTILKVAHHGSKTSSTEEFLNEVSPEIALIGVGEENNFGHPSNDVLDRLENMRIKVYRTDKMGEIILSINKKRFINKE